MSQPKFHSQPLGPIKDLDKMIEASPYQNSTEETRNLTIIYAKKKLQVQIPVFWTVNKLKCMMSIHFETLNFDKFQFQCNKMLIPGKTTVAQLPSDELIVTQAECPKAFEAYYKENIKKVVRKYQITSQNTLYPITHRFISQAMTESIPKERMGNIQQIPQNRRRQEPQGMMVLNILRIIGIAFMSNLILNFASYSQIAVLVCIALVYYLIDEYVKYNDRKRREQERKAQQEEAIRKKEEANKPKVNQKDQVKKPSQTLQKQYYKEQQPFLQEQTELLKGSVIQEDSQIGQNVESIEQILTTKQKQVPQRKIFKAKVILWTAFLVELFYCYILSIFPNWTVETHLHANQQKLDKTMDKVKKLDPEASEMIKKWQFKEIKLQQKGNNQDKKMKQQ